MLALLKVPDAKVLKMVKRAEVTLKLENGHRESAIIIFHSIDFIFGAYLEHIRGGLALVRTHKQNHNLDHLKKVY